MKNAVITAIRNSKQFTSAYVKSVNAETPDAITLRDGFTWSQLTKEQKRIYAQVQSLIALRDADRTLEAYNSRLPELITNMTHYWTMLTGDTLTISRNAADTLVISSRTVKMKDGELEDKLKGGFGKCLQMLCYLDTIPSAIELETALAMMDEAGVIPSNKKSKSKCKTIKVDPALLIKAMNGDEEALAKLNAILAA